MDDKERAKRRLSSGKALKVQENDMEINDDEAERTERRKIAAPIKPTTVSSESTSTWLRLFSEGKLGKKDVWTIPMMDMLTKEGQAREVDFRDASLTIDASAHVYSRRVEEVLNKTTSLAGGLASEDLNEIAVPDASDLTEALENSEDPLKAAHTSSEKNQGGDKFEEEVKKKKRFGASRLETEAALSMKKPEREYSIDPMFQSRSAVFDRGGAKGMLHVSYLIHDGFQLAFDADDKVDDQAPTRHTQNKVLDKELSRILSEFMKPNWQELEICPEYSERQKGSSHVMQDAMMIDHNEQARLEAALGAHETEQASNVRDKSNRNSMEIDGQAPGATETTAYDGEHTTESTFMTADANNSDSQQKQTNERVWEYDNMGGDDYGGMDDYQYGESSSNNMQGNEAIIRDGLEQQIARIEAVETEKDSATSGLHLNMYETSDSVPQEYTYFNANSLSNWHGPDHWKHRTKNIHLQNQEHKQSSKGKSSSSNVLTEDPDYHDEDGNVIKGVVKSGRASRKVFKIDYTAPLPDNLEELLAPSASGASLSKPTIDKQIRDSKMLLLPPDIQYDVRNFSALFLPHHVAVRRGDLSERRVEVDGQSSSNHVYDYGGADDDYGGFGYGDADGTMVDPDIAVMNPNLQSTTDFYLSEPRPGDSNYLPRVAKVDKRVDVKALKNTIWRELCTVEKETDQIQKEPTQQTLVMNKMTDEKPFQSVLEKLPQSIATEILPDISISYCFVCLLHLANEKHLAIRTNGMDELFVQQTAPSRGIVRN